MNKKVKKKKGISVTQEEDKAEFNEIFKFALTEDKLPQSSISVTIKQLHTGRDEHGRQLNSRPIDEKGLLLRHYHEGPKAWDRPT